MAAAQVEHDLAGLQAHGARHGRGQVERTAAHRLVVDLLPCLAGQLRVIGGVRRAEGWLWQSSMSIDGLF